MKNEKALAICRSVLALEQGDLLLVEDLLVKAG
jgi:hypothetical protein